MVEKTYWQRQPHITAVLQALLVTFIWSMSWVLIKIGLTDIPPLVFAGLRYFLAFLILLPLFLRSPQARTLTQLPRRTWLQLIVLGVIYYTVTQGTQFIGLFYLPAVTLNLMLSFTTVAVALFGIPLLGERINGRQWLGIVVAIAGTLIYFYPLQFPASLLIGLIIGVINVLANAASSLLGRATNRENHLSPLTITIITMGIGSTLLLATGIATQGFPVLSWQNWAIIGWLALVHTAFAFTLWNRTLRTLPAVESSIINNTMAIQIPILAVVFLGETISGRELVGLGVVIVGTVVVQMGRRR
jgi:drug/metabolite transporter (DMT)-like permease